MTADAERVSHTSGPWKATRSSPAEGYDCWWITANHERNSEKDLATVAGGARTSEANARLIAAAPDMLKENKRLRAALMKIHGHLGAAIVQRAPSDDEIIAAHIAEADAIALGAMARPLQATYSEPIRRASHEPR